ncbi:MAG: toprim domain-containing protein [Methylovirgula sp.]
MWVRPSPGAPDGFICGSFAGDDWQVCKDHVRQRLGLETFQNAKVLQRAHVEHTSAPQREHDTTKKAAALRLWHEAETPRGTIVEAYLNSRRLDLPDDIAGDVIRFHSACPWREGETTIRVLAMIAAMRSLHTDELVGIHRTRLTADGRKVDRRMLGGAAGAAIKLDGDATVTSGLSIGEGIETCLSARQIGLRPIWALGSAGAIANFPVLAGVETLTLLAENDEASRRAIDLCKERWLAARREVIIATPLIGGDLNDALRGAA